MWCQNLFHFYLQSRRAQNREPRTENLGTWEPGNRESGNRQSCLNRSFFEPQRAQRAQRFLNGLCHLSPVTCHLSPVTCHLSPLTFAQFGQQRAIGSAVERQLDGALAVA
jgi:hypothetical protein